MSVIRVKNHASLKTIGKELANASSCLIFTHVNIDGDCFGSAMAVCRMLRRRGKEAWIVLNDRLPDYLAFLTDDGEGNWENPEVREKAVAKYCTLDPEKDLPLLAKNPGISLAVDVSNERRITNAGEVFRRGKTISVDHHVTNDGFASMNHVNDCAANGEIIWRLFRAMDELPTKAEAEALYTAIVTDTGRFQYSSTSAETLRIVSNLYKPGIDQQRITINVYQSDRPEKVALHTRIMSRLEIIADGHAAIATMKFADLAETGATVDETEGLVEEIRNIRGVEVACFLRETDEGTVKASLRSKLFVDVAKISSENGGGGHKRAAGFTARATLEDETAYMKNVISEAVRNA